MTTRMRGRAVTPPDLLKLFGGDEPVSGLVLSADAVLTGAHESSSVKLARQDLSKVWEIRADRRTLHEIVGDNVSRVGPGARELCSLETGDVVWATDTERATFVDGCAVRWTAHGLEVYRVPAPTASMILGLPIDKWIQRAGWVCLYRHQEEPQSLGAFSPTRGAVLWESALERVMDDARPEPALHEFVGPKALTAVVWADASRFILRRSGSPKGASLFLCDTRTGAIQWQASPRLDTYAVTVVDSRVVVPKWKGVSVLDLATGALIADLTLPEMAKGTHPRPAVAFRGRVAVPYETGHIAVYDVASANPVHVLQTKHRFNRAIEADGRLILGTFTGSLVVYDETIWGFD